jgi:WD40 repeat protein
MTRDRSLIATMFQGVFTFWDAYTAEVIGQIDVSQTVAATADAVFSPDGTMIATVSSEGRLHLISVETGSILAEIQTIDWLIRSIDWSSDSRRIAITGRVGSVHIYGVPASEE